MMSWMNGLTIRNSVYSCKTEDCGQFIYQHQSAPQAAYFSQGSNRKVRMKPKKNMCMLTDNVTEFAKYSDTENVQRQIVNYFVTIS